MKLRPITPTQLSRIQAADELAKRAVAALREAGASKAAGAMARARKSIGGAIRHGQRCAAALADRES